MDPLFVCLLFCFCKEFLLNNKNWVITVTQYRGICFPRLQCVLLFPGEMPWILSVSVDVLGMVAFLLIVCQAVFLPSVCCCLYVLSIS